MSLRLSISATEQQNSFIVNDCTGKYSSSNQGGFGINNPRVQDIETSILEIETPKKNIFTLNVPPGDFPNEEGIGYEIIPYKLSMQELESGEYNIKLVITGTDKKGVPFKKSTSLKVFFTKTVSCCVDKMISRNIGTCDEMKKREMTSLNNLINSMNESIRCEKFSNATKIIDLLKEKCECCNCKN